MFYLFFLQKEQAQAAGVSGSGVACAVSASLGRRERDLRLSSSWKSHVSSDPTAGYAHKSAACVQISY